MKRKSLEYQKIRSKLQQRRKKDGTPPTAGTASSRGNSSNSSLHGSNNNSGDELDVGGQSAHLRSPRQPPTTPELKMVVAGIEEGMAERKRKDADTLLSAEGKERRRRAESDGGSSSSGGDEEDGESPKKRRKTGSPSQGHAQRRREAVQLCLNAVTEAEQRLGQPVPDASTIPIYYRWSSLARAKASILNSPSFVAVLYVEPAWQFLSNMSPFPVNIDGILYPTLEHYYHVMKFVHARSMPIKFDSVEQMRNNPVVAKILSMPDPEKVKQLMGKKGSIGKKLPFNWAAWSKAIPQLMTNAKLQKARQYPGIKRLLLESGNRTIAERKLSHRKKTPPEPSDIRGMLVFYKGQWYGDNASGKMWMRVRKQLQQEEWERTRILERARNKGKIVLIEHDEDENVNGDDVEAIVEELIEEEEVDGDDASRDSEDGDGNIVIDHGDEHVTIVHNPDKNESEDRRHRPQQDRKNEARFSRVKSRPLQRPQSYRMVVEAVGLEAESGAEEVERRGMEATSAQTALCVAGVETLRRKRVEAEEVDLLDVSESEESDDDSDSADDSDSDSGQSEEEDYSDDDL